MGYKSLGRKPHEDVYGSWEKVGVFPDEGDVDEGVTYGPDGTTRTGTLVLPAESDVISGVQYGAGGTEFTGSASTGGAGFTDAFSLKLVVAETANVVPTDVDTYAIALLQGDTNADLTETVKLGFSGTDFSDSSVVPTDAIAVTLRVWLSASAGTGVTNPANANGQNDAARAVISTAIAGATTETLTSDANSISGITIISALYRGWFNYQTTLPTSTISITAHSTTAAFADFNMLTDNGAALNVNHDGGTFTFDLLAAGVNTLAKVQSLQVLHNTSDAAAGVTPAVFNVDAGCVEMLATFGVAVTWNPLDKGANINLSGGDLTAATVATGGSVRATTSKSSGVYMYELRFDSGFIQPGFAKSTAALAVTPGDDPDGWAYYSFNGDKRTNSVGTAFGASYGAGDYVQCVWDATAGSIFFYKNGALQGGGAAFTGLSGAMFPAFGGSNSGDGATANFGATAFAFPIAGATAWNA